MLHRVGVASPFAATASLLSGIAAVAHDHRANLMSAQPTRAAALLPVESIDARVRSDDGMAEAYKHAREQCCQGGED